MLDEFFKANIDRHVKNALFYRNWAHSGSKTFKCVRLAIAIKEMEEARELKRDLENIKY